MYLKDNGIVLSDFDFGLFVKPQELFDGRLPGLLIARPLCRGVLHLPAHDLILLFGIEVDLSDRHSVKNLLALK